MKEQQWKRYIKANSSHIYCQSVPKIISDDNSNLSGNRTAGGDTKYVATISAKNEDKDDDYKRYSVSNNPYCKRHTTSSVKKPHSHLSLLSRLVYCCSSSRCIVWDKLIDLNSVKYFCCLCGKNLHNTYATSKNEGNNLICWISSEEDSDPLPNVPDKPTVLEPSKQDMTDCNPTEEMVLENNKDNNDDDDQSYYDDEGVKITK